MSTTLTELRDGKHSGHFKILSKVTGSSRQVLTCTHLFLISLRLQHGVFACTRTKPSPTSTLKFISPHTGQYQSYSVETVLSWKSDLMPKTSVVWRSSSKSFPVTYRRFYSTASQRCLLDWTAPSQTVRQPPASRCNTKSHQYVKSIRGRAVWFGSTKHNSYFTSQAIRTFCKIAQCTKTVSNIQRVEVEVEAILPQLWQSEV
jgi:hypothetical protein